MYKRQDSYHLAAKARRVAGRFGGFAREWAEVTLALIPQGGEDTLVPPRETEVLGRLPGVTRKLYPTLRHETLFEPEGPAVADDIIGWLREAVAQRG